MESGGPAQSIPPGKPMSNTATRLITLIMLLQRQPGQKASDLAQELGVSVRSLHRYISMLDEMGIPVYSERGPQGGFSLVRGYRMPPLVLTPEEAASVALGAGLVRDMWGDLYAGAAAGAMAKIENVLPDDQRVEVAWARRSLISAGLRCDVLAENQAALAVLRDAIRDRRRVRMLYRSVAQADARERDVSPYVLAHSRGWWYVVGFCHLRRDVRTFRIDRILEVRPLAQDADIPAEFDPRPYLRMEHMPPDSIRARLRFAKESAGLASMGRSLWESEEQLPDGSLIVAFSQPHLEWAASFTLSFGPAVHVEEPEALRRMVAQWAEAVAGQYRNDLPSPSLRLPSTNGGMPGGKGEKVENT
jgi:predicted DNA-binding transcriptional regulator YafY